MIVLTIETSTPAEQVAVVRNGTVLAEVTETVGRGHTEMLLGAVDAVLMESALALTDLDAIVVAVGPGRFSGLRVGLATAKGLAAVAGVPVIPVDTLRALAESAGPVAGLVAPLLDARRGEVYGALFRLGPLRERLLHDTAAPPRAMLELILDAAAGEHVTLTGNGAPMCAGELQEMGLGDG
ncbi:MAG: tRNA (adenosine(37)-N6)-threonylcarbamoyltransferase complex dimerization subunit type 1 TsaB, partial [Candidatus Eisenbacteria bacterium]|nr:tRNA (adenosine(37)-N6)-threonylcarbamoyltransferase complex dimerization subunit type 1 TsaB [Candidatus Eisenbacteria bacterium]